MYPYNQFGSQWPGHRQPPPIAQRPFAAPRPPVEAFAFSARAVTLQQPGAVYMMMPGLPFGACAVPPLFPYYYPSPFFYPSMPSPGHNVASAPVKAPTATVHDLKVNKSTKYYVENHERYLHIKFTARACPEGEQQDEIYTCMVSERDKLYELELFNGESYDPAMLSNCLEYQKVYESLCLKILSTPSVEEQKIKYIFLHHCLAKAYGLHLQQFLNFVNYQINNDYYPLRLIQDVKQVLSSFALVKLIITSPPDLGIIGHIGRLGRQIGSRDQRIGVLENRFQWGIFNWSHKKLYAFVATVIRTHIKYVAYLHTMPCADIRKSAEAELWYMFVDEHPFQVLLKAYKRYFDNEIKSLEQTIAGQARTGLARILQGKGEADYPWQPFARALKHQDYAEAADIVYQRDKPDWRDVRLLGDIMQRIIDRQLETVCDPSRQITCDSLPVLKALIDELKRISDTYKVIFDNNPELKNYWYQTITNVRSRVSKLELAQLEQQS